MLRAVLALRLREPKIPKSKTFLRGPKLLDFLIFLRFFWFSKRNPEKKTWCFLEKIVFFGFPTEIKKHRVFLVFHQRPNKTTKETLCFLVFHLKPKKTM